MSTTNRGFAFSLDLALATIAIILMLFTVAFHFNERTKIEVESIKKFQLEKNALFVADSLVKNDSESVLRGSAKLDEKKKRVKSNELDISKLDNAKVLVSEEFFVKRLSLKTKSGKHKAVVLEERESENCFGVERIVFGEELALVEVLVCEK